ncbi:uncharacterized protein V6R79_022746 [Siganus canaliculatus]
MAVDRLDSTFGERHQSLRTEKSFLLLLHKWMMLMKRHPHALLDHCPWFDSCRLAALSSLTLMPGSFTESQKVF